LLGRCCWHRPSLLAILYVNRTGIAWKYLPHDFAAWRDKGIFAQLNIGLTALA
jgi:transposase